MYLVLNVTIQSVNGSNESEIREMRKNGRYLQNVYAKMHVPHVALCVCLGTMRVPDSHNEYDILKHAQKESWRYWALVNSAFAYFNRSSTTLVTQQLTYPIPVLPGSSPPPRFENCWIHPCHLNPPPPPPPRFENCWIHPCHINFSLHVGVIQSTGQDGHWSKHYGIIVVNSIIGVLYELESNVRVIVSLYY